MSLSSSHHPQHDGQTEVVNKLLMAMLHTFVEGKKDQWSIWLHLLEFVYNSAIHSSTGTTPFHLLLGFHPRTPLDFIGTKGLNKVGSHSLNLDAVTFLENFTMHRDSVHAAIAKAQDQQAKSFNKGWKLIPHLKKGNRVLVNPRALEWVESKGKGKKLAQQWIGPFEVTQRINPNVYHLRLINLYPRLPIFNYQHLKKYEDSPMEYGNGYALPETRTAKPTQEEYEVKRIIAERRTKKGVKYLVRWTGYSPLYNMWEPKRALTNAPEVVLKWKNAHKLSQWEL